MLTTWIAITVHCTCRLLTTWIVIAIYCTYRLLTTWIVIAVYCTCRLFATWVIANCRTHRLLAVRSTCNTSIGWYFNTMI